MDQDYWIGRKRASAANAKKAGSAQARLVHLDLAGRYSVLAAAAASRMAGEALPGAGMVRPDAAYYEELETGARWLASRSSDDGERQEHLRIAGKYARLRVEAAVALHR